VSEERLGLKRVFYIVLGTVSLALGVIGVFLPVIPTTPFILLSAWFYLRGSERFYNWLFNHDFFGPLIKEYSDDKGIRKESKVKAILLTWIAVLLTAMFILESNISRAAIIVFAIIGTLILLRLKTRE
jgi:uncharacterized membrane protein YbaN (DUF454 family)